VFHIIAGNIVGCFTESFFRRDISRSGDKINDEFFSYPSNAILPVEVGHNNLEENEENSIMRKVSTPNKTTISPTSPTSAPDNIVHPFNA
jgi:hypothetical protein